MTANAAAPRIAIVGGGIGGLAAAAFLHRQGLPATVYEQAARLTEVGAGLVVAPNLARLVRRLGVLDDLRERATQLDTGWEFRRWTDGTVLSSENLAEACEKLYGEHTYTMHRADLLRVIQSAVPAESVQLGRKRRSSRAARPRRCGSAPATTWSTIPSRQANGSTSWPSPPPATTRSSRGPRPPPSRSSSPSSRAGTSASPA